MCSTCTNMQHLTLFLKKPVTLPEEALCKSHSVNIISTSKRNAVRVLADSWRVDPKQDRRG